MPSVNKILPNYTYEEYCLWEGKWEIIDGIPYAMTPAPSLRHQRIAMEIGVVLHQELKTRGCSCRVYQPIDIRISDHTVVQPDLSILCKTTSENYVDFPPALVVEILSLSTREKDLITKRELYADFGIRYYIIVDPKNDKLTSLKLDDGKYLEMGPPFDFKLERGCTISPDFSEVFR